MPSSIQVPYTGIQNSAGEITPRPVLTVAIGYQNKSVQTAGLLDSGADVSVLPYGVGIALGLNWDEQPYRLKLSGNMARFETRIVFLSVTVSEFVPVDLVFAWTQAEQAPLIFGQANFFQAFNVCFFRAASYFTLTASEAAME